MSFDINWSQFASNPNLNERIRLFIDEELHSITLPSFIDNLTVEAFSLGEKAPEITIRHIGDPFEEFYADENDNDEEAHPVPQSTPSLNGYGDDDSSEDEQCLKPEKHSDLITKESSTVKPLDASGSGQINSQPQTSRKGSDSVRYFSNYNMNNLGLGPTELDLPASIFSHSAYRQQNGSMTRSKMSERGANDIQFMLEVDFQSNIVIELKINLLVNYPLAHFISLPIKLRITDLAIHSLAAVAYLKNKVFISILCDLNDSAADYFTSSQRTTMSRESGSSSQNTPAGGNFVDYSTGNTRERIDVIRSINIDSEIGEVESNVLRNVGKVEKFLVEQLRGIIRDEICWPGWLCFDLNEDE